MKNIVLVHGVGQREVSGLFCRDVDPEKAAFMADSQVPWGLEAVSGPISEPAWRTKPSWYLVVTRRQNDPAGRTACHVKTGGLQGCRGQRQPRHLRFAASGCRSADRRGHQGYSGQGGLTASRTRVASTVTDPNVALFLFRRLGNVPAVPTLKMMRKA